MFDNIIIEGIFFCGGGGLKKGGLTLHFKNRLYLNKITFFGKEKKKYFFIKGLLLNTHFYASLLRIGSSSSSLGKDSPP